MTLNLIRSEDTYNHPEQKWSFTSDYAIRDYSGTYTIKLIPCTTNPDQKYSIPVKCNPRDPLTFNMDIRFQQVSDPVAAEFTLNTNFFLLSKKSLYLSDGSMGFAEDSDAAFVEGAEIYGRVLVDPVQNLGNSFDANIEKVFLCSGRDGYVPKYDPSRDEYGCLADSPNLRDRFKVLDKEQPDTQDTEANSVDFNARLAIDDAESLTIVRQPGTDGFRLDSAPLFTVTVGREWYMHTIYTVRATDSRKRRSISKRFHSIKSSASNVARYRRDIDELAQEIGEQHDRGTNMNRVQLDWQSPPIPPRQRKTTNIGTNQSGPPLLIMVIGGVCLLLVAMIVLMVVLLMKRRNNKKQGPVAANNTKYTGGKHIVAKKTRRRAAANIPPASASSSSGYNSSEDGSEV